MFESSLVRWTFSCRVMHEFAKRDYPARQNRRGSDLSMYEYSATYNFKIAMMYND